MIKYKIKDGKAVTINLTKDYNIPEIISKESDIELMKEIIVEKKYIASGAFLRIISD